MRIGPGGDSGASDSGRRAAQVPLAVVVAVEVPVSAAPVPEEPVSVELLLPDCRGPRRRPAPALLLGAECSGIKTAGPTPPVIPQRMSLPALSLSTSFSASLFSSAGFAPPLVASAASRSGETASAAFSATVGR